jgi:hypothetical protein
MSSLVITITVKAGFDQSIVAAGFLLMSLAPWVPEKMYPT